MALGTFNGSNDGVDAPYGIWCRVTVGSITYTVLSRCRISFHEVNGLNGIVHVHQASRRLSNALSPVYSTWSCLQFNQYLNIWMDNPTVSSEKANGRKPD